MSLRKVTYFDRKGVAIVPVEEDGQAKPAVLGVRNVNRDTLETIRVRGGNRTGRYSEVLQKIPPTLSTDPFALDELAGPQPKSPK